VGAVQETVCGEMYDAVLAEFRADSRLPAGVKVERLFAFVARHERINGFGFPARERQAREIETLICADLLRGSRQCCEILVAARACLCYRSRVKRRPFL